VSGVSYAVAGTTAGNYDDTAAVDAAAPTVFAFVAVLAFLLLMAAFRSVTIPLVSIVLNLLSVGAGYGLVTLIFQDGRLQGLGYTSFGGIIPWIPPFMFVLLFGLSMDYHVFILSRIRELHMREASTEDAVTGGISSSAGVVTSAAVIMVAVFSILATLPNTGHAADCRYQDTRRRPGCRRADGRYCGPRYPAARRHVPARRPLLVLAALDVLAASGPKRDRERRS
jgi:RND superfamily putative drug exporter